MYKFCSPKAFKWLSTPEKFYNESLYWILLSPNRWKILSKIPGMHYWPRKVDTDQFVVYLVRLRVPSAFVQPADSTPSR